MGKKLKRYIKRVKKQASRNSLRSKMAGSRAYRDERISEAKADKKKKISTAKKTIIVKNNIDIVVVFLCNVYVQIFFNLHPCSGVND